MTTIAFDGKTLAADRCSWSGGCRRQVRKVFRVTATDGRRFLVAFAGNGMFAGAVLAWMRGEREAPNWEDFGKAEERDHQCALVIDEQYRIWQLGNQLTYSRERERIYAFGGGQDIAWGALEAGATARQAIKIAMKRGDYAGLGVDSVSF